MKRWATVLLLAAFSPVEALVAQQTGRIAGLVTSDQGQPLAGANVVVVGTQIGTLTGQDGRYVIPGVAPGTHQVQASLIGYAPATVTVTVAAGQTATANFQLSSQAIALEEIVAVGYGQQRRVTLTGSVASVSAREVEAFPAANVSNALTGRLPGVVTINTSAEPGYDGATIRIRGSHTLGNNNPLVVIDGVPERGGLERLDPQEIESITVLKDASAAIYGSRAANGVILITTKRGRAGSPPEFTVTLNQGFNQPTRIPEMADAATYMEMLNEIDLYRGRSPRYTQEQIENHRKVTDPWLYPNTDWFKEALKPMSFQTRGNVALRGASERLGYYLSLSGLTQDGYYRNSQTRYNQYGFRSNIDGHINDYFSVRFDLSGRLEDRNFPNRSAGAIFRALMRGKPNLPAYWPNGLPGPDIEYGDNPVVIGTPATGYDRDKRYYLLGNVGLDFKVPWLEGLTLRANASYDQLFRRQKRWRKPWTLYTWDYKTRDANGNPVLTPAKRGYEAPELLQTDTDSTGITLNLLAEFRRDFGSHTVGILAGTERQKADWGWIEAFRKYYISDQIDQFFAGGDAEKNNNGSAGVLARQTYFTRVNYDFRDKYLFEFIGRYDGSYIFAPGKRFGFFPAVSAGWRISEEPFFRDRFPVFSELKLRASVGQTGNDRIGAWQYLASYGFGGGYVIGTNREVKSIYQTRTPNPNITWEVANQFDVGMDGGLFNNRLTFELDYFWEKRSDILLQRNASVPRTTGLSLPAENIGKVSSWGYDGTIRWQDDLSEDVSYNVSVNFGYNQNKIDFWDEPPGAPDYQRSTGRRMNTGLYYRAIGVFKDSAALAAYPHWAGARPGDIIFEDVNKDGKIDANDRVRASQNGDPTFLGGVSLGLQVKNFDVSLFFQGATGAVQYVLTESGDIGNFLADFAEKRWRPDRPSDKHPRTFNRQDEYWISNGNTYFLRDADYLRLKTIEIGYTFTRPDPMVASSEPFVARLLPFKRTRIYVSGFNVLTFDKLKLFDPEARNQSGQYYPQARVFNAGVSVTF